MFHRMTMATSKGMGLPRSFTPPWSGSPTARSLALRQVFKEAHLGAIGSSQEGDQGGGKGKSDGGFLTLGERWSRRRLDGDGGAA
jgi:hypothetical protein